MASSLCLAWSSITPVSALLFLPLYLTRDRSPRLQTWSRRDGRIRLSTDDGPPAAEFLEDDYDDDNTGLTIEESLAVSRSELSLNPAAHTSTHHLLLLPDDRSLANATSVWSDNSEGHEVPESPPK
jgi:hypothetical protein